ncbi:MAG: LTA synthase family protein [Oscillospiraceae bacterium]|nr:LTA synthase family protein [Oscillospiraceae bacterium]
MKESLRLDNVARVIRESRDRKVLKILAYISLPFFPLFCLFILEYMNFGGRLERTLEFLEWHPLAALFSALILSVLFLVLLLLCRKAVIAGGILGFFSLLFAYINYTKVALHGDNFFPLDIAMMGQTGELMSFVLWNVPRWFGMGIILVAVWVFLLWFFRVEIPLGWKIRLPAAVCVILAAGALFWTSARSEAVLNRFEMSFFDAALQSSNYTANGFVGAFTINLLSMNIERPEDYSRETIEALLRGFEATPTTEEYFDVIVVMSESFFDVRLIPTVEFSENTLPNFDRLRESPGAVSGLLYVSAMGGGTIKPEFEILTGLTMDHLPGGVVPYAILRGPMETYVSNYRDAGYWTVALHPFTERFYSRHTAYPLLGFDDFFGYEALMERFDLEYRHRFVSDISLMEPITYFLDGADGPTFMFVITMQNHQPFPPMYADEIVIEVTSDVLRQELLDTVTTFTQGLRDADTMLGMLADYVDSRERPTALLFFGDHLPALGPFAHLGLIEYGPHTFFTHESQLRLLSTPFLIYSNRDLAPGVFESRMENQISTYYLLATLAELTGFQRTPYMNLLLDYRTRVPFHNTRLLMPETDEIRSLMRMLRLITYDRLAGNAYSVMG